MKTYTAKEIERNRRLPEWGKSGGRPSEERTKRMYIRISEDEKKQLKRLCKINGLTASEFARRKVFAHEIKQATEVDFEINNLLQNYITNFKRIGNMYKNRIEFREINKQVMEVIELLTHTLKTRL